jgi:hypothetical protein
MDEMATDSYMPTLEGSLLNDSVDRLSLLKQEARDLIMRTETDPMILVYRDCLLVRKYSMLRI